MTTQSLDLNLIPKGISPRLYVSQYDKGQTWTFNIYAGNTAYTIPNGATVTIQGTKPDKTGFQYSCTASGNVVTATEQQQMTVIAGEVPAEIRITNNNEIIATLNFILVVEPAALTDETEISETDLPIIEQAIEMFPHYQEMIDDVSSDIATLSNVRAELGAHNINGTKYLPTTYSTTDVNATFVVNDNGTVTASGTNNASSAVNCKIEDFVSPITGDVLVSIGAGSGVEAFLYDSTRGGRAYTDSTKTTTTGDITGNNVIQAYLEKGHSYYLGLRISANSSVSNVTFYPMIRHDTDPTYQPYAKTNVELTKDDSGLTDNQFENGAVNEFKHTVTSMTEAGITYIVNDDDSITLNGTASATNAVSLGFFKGKAGVQYRVSGCPQGGSASKYSISVAGGYEIGGGRVITGTGSNTQLAIYVVKNTVCNNITFKPMITLADMPNSDYAHYVPYCKSNKELTEELSVIGNYVVSQPESSVSVPNNTGTEIASITLNKGVWLLIGCVNASSGTGTYSAQFDSSAKNAARDKTVTNQLMSDRQAFTQVSVVKNIQSDSTEVKLYSYYTGAGSLTVYPYIMAVKIK